MSPSPDRSPKSPRSPLTNQPSPDEQPPVASDPTPEVSTPDDPLDYSAASAPESDSSEKSGESPAEPTPLVPKRPLMRPVSRPEPPPATQPVAPQKPAALSTPVQPTAPTQEGGTGTDDATDEPDLSGQAVSRQQPIPPPSEPKQYRAIGLVRGRYAPSEEQFTRGTMVTADGAEIEAVLLGRVMSLVRNHLDLQQDHLWVVYPRTREAQENLHVQIVGVWEPEKLQKNADDDAEDSAEELVETPSSEESLSPGFDDDYFSIRGEVVFYSPDDKNVVVKIQQAARKSSDKAKAFKLKLDGTLTSSKTVGYFWDLQVKRSATALVITEGTAIGLVPPKKKTKTDFRQDRRPQKGFRGPRPTGGGRGAPKPSGSGTGAPRREPPPKPVKRSEQSKED
ncbi:hypothetical protein K9N68_08755 [Kovacikia minuta CCNUW1]|uniref:hypothetical protein n=1 Tax=Kovacikia minuta TaxID=2931930 RepID=UPI001CC9FD06|nr:hypothetical protein [Kovacikia minuta]UBF27967.1 hypothetical protein K9N68_08755 [Kovacikia minuta CCNUW1]